MATKLFGRGFPRGSQDCGPKMRTMRTSPTFRVHGRGKRQGKVRWANGKANPLVAVAAAIAYEMSGGAAQSGVASSAAAQARTHIIGRTNREMGEVESDVKSRPLAPYGARVCQRKLPCDKMKINGNYVSLLAGHCMRERN